MTLIENPRRAHDPFAPPVIEQVDAPALKRLHDSKDVVSVRALFGEKPKRKPAARKSPARTRKPKGA